jgi:hypothetical protein
MRQALELALEALEKLTNAAEGFSVSGVYFNEELWARKCLDDAYDAMGFAQEALAQPEQEPVAWKLVPTKPTEEMLKAMDECSMEGYDERLYAGHAASVFMAAVDVAPTPPQRKPLTDDEIAEFAERMEASDPTDSFWREFARAIEAAHGIKE